MRKIIVKIGHEAANYIERINYELNFTKDIIQRLIEAHPNDSDLFNGTAFKTYQKQGAELQAEYAIACAEIEDKYVPETLKGHQISWNIPANSDELIITVLCNCEIEGVE